MTITDYLFLIRREKYYSQKKRELIKEHFFKGKTRKKIRNMIGCSATLISNAYKILIEKKNWRRKSALTSRSVSLLVRQSQDKSWGAEDKIENRRECRNY